ncbi:hypothetical protein [Pseudoalteromonas rubra]|uniref:WG repeat-containing protein n=1 Tax=Pseudoalteromonas rubra TaxID=43658 RepID=A0A5S3WUN7_9GAMM|nr:hypothetical protein [Pseudoalteromonas rubra]TMP33447.1 hypothetical protein CWB98_19995 [Pseudoalteromonas rubra]
MRIWLVMLLMFAFSVNAEEVICAYNDSSTYELEVFKNCGSLGSDGLLKVNPDLLPKVRWHKFGMSCINVRGEGWFFLNQNGLARGAPFLQDNDCNPFSEGLAVGISNGKIVYYDQVLSIIKKTDYTWSGSFHKKHAKVCKGTLIREYDASGEHYSLTGGNCGYINREFEVVVPTVFDFQSTPVPEGL